MLSTIPSATLLGVDGSATTVEVHISNGIPCFTVVGLPDASCREARDRVRAALLSSKLPWPNKRVTVNLAPSAIRKSGAGLDLPIAMGLLVAEEKLRPEDLYGMAFIGELGLDGTIRPVPGVLSLVEAIEEPVVIVPRACVAEASVLGRHKVRTAGSLRELFDCLDGKGRWVTPPPDPEGVPPPEPDLAEVRGQPMARAALEVAAAGGHHLLLVGPPGAGKSMLARRLPGLLPALTPEEAFAVTRVHSAAGLTLPPGGIVQRPPFRSPHHGASAVALVGGGSGSMRPGEISCAHFGCLFLDELAEFPTSVLDMLRQPIEDGAIRVSRAHGSVTFPARFLLVGAMNPCPCGEGLAPGCCRCGEAARVRYAGRISGPLLDRFDLRVLVERPEITQLLPSSARSGTASTEEPTSVVAARVEEARRVAARRGYRCNADVPGWCLDQVAPLMPAARAVLEAGFRSGRLSARGLDRVRRVARTLADLGGRTGPIGEEDMCGATVLHGDPFPPVAVPA